MQLISKDQMLEPTEQSVANMVAETNNTNNTLVTRGGQTITHSNRQKDRQTITSNIEILRIYSLAYVSHNDEKERAGRVYCKSVRDAR
jgi:hypothetical protein